VETVLAKIALQLDRALARRRSHDEPGCARSSIVARGDGWSVADVICTSGPQDRSFEEQHTHYSIAVVVAGSFQYRSTSGHALMTPGSLLLGNRGHCYECGHDHADGDRCVSFWYEPDYFESLAAAAGHKGGRLEFAVPRIPPHRRLAPMVAAAAAGVTASIDLSWEEMAVRLAVSAIRLTRGVATGDRASVNAEARVTRAIRMIDRHPTAALTLTGMAREAGVSPYHFLRCFERVTGVTPHQYVLRTRLRDAALRLATGPGKVVDVAFDCGFGDISNFNRAFRAEFGVSPSRYNLIDLAPHT
jgi:AraC family transcriptional regulator